MDSMNPPYIAEGIELNVEESELGTIEPGTSLTVKRLHVNKFSGRETITVAAEPLPDHRVTSFQLMRLDSHVWKEIIVGSEGDTVVLSTKGGELFYDATCLDCGASYTEDVVENLATCRHCGSEQLEWEGFRV